MYVVIVLDKIVHNVGYVVIVLDKIVLNVGWGKRKGEKRGCVGRGRKGDRRVGVGEQDKKDKKSKKGKKGK